MSLSRVCWFRSRSRASSQSRRAIDVYMVARRRHGCSAISPAVSGRQCSAEGRAQRANNGEMLRRWECGVCDVMLMSSRRLTKKIGVRSRITARILVGWRGKRGMGIADIRENTKSPSNNTRLTTTTPQTRARRETWSKNKKSRREEGMNKESQAPHMRQEPPRPYPSICP
jgi:hypothetical protein